MPKDDCDAIVQSAKNTKLSGRAYCLLDAAGLPVNPERILHSHYLEIDCQPQYPVEFSDTYQETQRP
jgi:hypothetical protein